MTPVAQDRGLEALARAYDREEAACMGEPSPWDSGADDAEWVAERISCASAAISAYLAATLPPDVAGLVERLAKRAHKWRGNDDGAFVGIKLGDLRSVITALTALTALSARDAKMREALEPFADLDGEGDEDFGDDEPVVIKFGRTSAFTVKLGDLRRARLASDRTGDRT